MSSKEQQQEMSESEAEATMQTGPDMWHSLWQRLAADMGPPNAVANVDVKQVQDDLRRVEEGEAAAARLLATMGKEFTPFVREVERVFLLSAEYRIATHQLQFTLSLGLSIMEETPEPQEFRQKVCRALQSLGDAIMDLHRKLHEGRG